MSAAATEYVEPRLLPRHERGVRVSADRQTMAYVTLMGVFALAFTVRLYSVIRYESVIHEFDPQFNFKATQKLADDGGFEFMNWFDTAVWYPLGRWVGHTVYPGLMATAAGIHALLHAVGMPVALRNVCVFFAPVFAGNTAVVTYLLTKECFDEGAALFAAVFVSVMPGYTSRSVAGSYDNEAVAIFALVNTFYFWVKAVKTGSMRWAAAAACAYAYMITTWGGYLYIANLIPLYVFSMVLLGRYTHRLYVSYSVWHILGSLLGVLIPFVGFNVIFGATHALGHAVFVLLQLHNIVGFLKTHLGFQKTVSLARSVAGFVFVALVVGMVVALGLGGEGRLVHLLGGGKSALAIVNSVAEHQMSTWASFWNDYGILLFFSPIGMYYCVGEWTDAALFLLAYYATSMYFCTIMVRLLLVHAPVVAMMAGIGISRTLVMYMPVWLSGVVVPPTKKTAKPAPKAHGKGGKKNEEPEVVEIAPIETFKEPRVPWNLAALVLLMCVSACLLFTVHSRWVTSAVYSSPSIILRVNAPNGQQVFYDDYREAYFWMRQNTPPDAKMMSWWDYGYQAATMANRSTIVDNNTWNNTHIATVGKCMASSEEECYRILRRLDVDYVFVVFGGLIAYSSDDIAKFMWMIKIAGSVYPEVQTKDYMNAQGRYSVGPGAPAKLTNSMMYKMCYYRFDEVSTEDASKLPSAGQRPEEARTNVEYGYDRTRKTTIARKGFKFRYLEEAFTSSHWMLRIYKVLKEPIRG